MSYGFDEGLALFAGLNIPKRFLPHGVQLPHPTGLLPTDHALGSAP